MAIIRVTPSTLRQSGQDLAQAGNNTARIGSDVWNAGAGAPNYDGQFGSHVREMAAEANARAQSFSNRLAEYSNRLENKASAFEAADLASVAGVGPTSLPRDWRDTLSLLGQISLWYGIPVAAIERYLQLGLLTNLGAWAGQLANGVIPRSSFQLGWLGQTFLGTQVSASGLSNSLLAFSKGAFDSAAALDKLQSFPKDLALALTAGGEFVDKAFTDNFGPLHIALTCGAQWVADVRTYKDDPAKLASAAVSDTVVKVGLTAAGDYVGASVGAAFGGAGGSAIGAAIGQVLIPIPVVGAVIGGSIGEVAGEAIGGVAGKLVGDWVADRAFDAYKDSSIRGTIIDDGAVVVTDVAKEADQAVGDAVKAIQSVPWPKLPVI